MEENHRTALQLSVDEAEAKLSASEAPFETERQEHLRIINNLAFREDILRGLHKEIAEMYANTKELLLATIHKYAPEKEYIKTLEFIADRERNKLAVMRSKSIFSTLLTQK